jgi:hypothetical protein
MRYIFLEKISDYPSETPQRPSLFPYTAERLSRPGILDLFRYNHKRGPKARDKPAQGEARNERSPGFAPSPQQAPKGRDNESGQSFI